MKFAIWQTVNFADCALGYKPGALMKQVWVGEMPWFDKNTHVTQVLDRIWLEFQRIDEDRMPPEEYEGRSLSIGDVVQLVASDGTEGEAWFTPVSPTGWESVDPIENMACPDCDGEWPAGDRFCPKCGLAIEDIAERLVQSGGP